MCVDDAFAETFKISTKNEENKIRKQKNINSCKGDLNDF